jgi:PAS domain S-box-containing protein
VAAQESTLESSALIASLTAEVERLRRRVAELESTLALPTAHQDPAASSRSESNEVPPTAEPGASLTLERDSRQLLQLVLDHAPIVLWSVDRDGRFTVSAGRGLESLGLKPGEALGRSVWEMYRDHNSILTEIRRSFTGVESEFLVEMGDKAFESWHAPYQLPNGTIHGVMGVAVDISSRVSAERERRAEMQRFRQLFRRSPVGMVLTRSSDQQILIVNRAFGRLVGRPSRRLRGLRLTELQRQGLSGIAEPVASPTSTSGSARGSVQESLQWLQPETGPARLVSCLAERLMINGEDCTLNIVLDVTERVRAERQLRRSRMRFRTLVKLAPVPLFQTSADGCLRDASARFRSEFGLGQQRTSEIPWWQLLSVESPEEIAQWWQTNPETWRRDGEGYGSDAIDSNGAKVTETAARSNYIPRNSLPRTAPILSNHVAHSEFESAAANGAAAQGSVTYRSREVAVLVNGQLRYFLLQREPERNLHGHCRGFICSLTEITSRRQAELQITQQNTELERQVMIRTSLLANANRHLLGQARRLRLTLGELRMAEERWQALATNAPVGILLIHRDGRIAFANHTLLRPELTVDELVGKSVLDFVRPHQQADVEELLTQVFDHHRTQQIEICSDLPNGQTQWLQCSVAPIVVQRETHSAVLIVRDITSERKAADSLRQTQQQLLHVARLSSLGEMAGTICHELRQPLQSIRHYLTGCQIRASAKDVDLSDVVMVLNHANDEASRMADVMQRIRQFVTRRELQLEKVSLNQLAQDASALVQSSLAGHRVGLQTILDPQLPELLADRIQIVQVIVNLLVNAAEAMALAEPPAAPNVSGAVGVIELETRCGTGHSVQLVVKDQGPGIPVDQREAIFEAFVTQKPQGLGIGLSVSRSIIRAHQGAIYVDEPIAPWNTVMVVELPIEVQVPTKSESVRAARNE